MEKVRTFDWTGGEGGKAFAELCYVKKFMSKVQPFHLIERGGVRLGWTFLCEKNIFFGWTSGGEGGGKGGSAKSLNFFQYFILKAPLTQGEHCHKCKVLITGTKVPIWLML